MLMIYKILSIKLINFFFLKSLNHKKRRVKPDNESFKWKITDYLLVFGDIFGLSWDNRPTMNWLDRGKLRRGTRTNNAENHHRLKEGRQYISEKKNFLALGFESGYGAKGRYGKNRSTKVLNHL